MRKWCPLPFWQKYSVKVYSAATNKTVIQSFLMHAVCERLQRILCVKDVTKHFGSLGPIPMIYPSFNSSCIAPQSGAGTKFSYYVFPELDAVKSKLSPS